MFYADRLSVVTGGSGFIGTHIAREVLAQGGRVRLVLHKRAPLLTDPHVETVHADLTRPDECLAALRGAQIVFHAAGAVAGLGVQGNNAMAGITANLTLTANVLQAAWDVGAERALIFSSSTVYPAWDSPLSEEQAAEGPAPSYLGYGTMRRYFERLSEFVAGRSNLKIALVRPTAVYGPHDDFGPVTSHVISALVRRAVEKTDPFEVWGTGDEQRDFLHVEDLARGCLLMVERHAACDPVNIGYGEGITIRHAAEIILDAAGHRVTPRFDPTKPTGLPMRLADISKARSVLGFKPRILVEQGLRDLVAWYRDNRSVTR